MNLLYSLPDEIIEYIYFINHKSYQKEINNFIHKLYIYENGFFYEKLLDKNYIKSLTYHIENTFSP